MNHKMFTFVITVLSIKWQIFLSPPISVNCTMSPLFRSVTCQLPVFQGRVSLSIFSHFIKNIHKFQFGKR